MARAYKITEVCGDWALHIPPYGKTDAEMILIFNSRNNAELVKSVLEWEDAHPNAAVPYKSTLAPPNEAPPCYQPDGDGCAYQCYDGDDEPIDKCKECPLCYSDKQRHHAPPNDPLTIEQLREMDGEPVFVVIDDGIEPLKMWALVDYIAEEKCLTLTNNLGGRSQYYTADDLEIDHITVYRRPPEGKENT